MAATFTQHPASYRDPSGFVFTHNGEVFRQINLSFKEHWDAFHASGLYNDLVASGRLISHTSVEQNLTGLPNWYRTIQPEPLQFISYPYEWTFGMLKDAALLTLEIAAEALQNSFVLKDASPYNVQLHGGKMIFIDSLSFENYTDGEPWVAYRQFCEAFLAPLALMHFCQLPLNGLFLAFPDGVPLLHAKKLLPIPSRFHLQLYLHLHLHASQSSKKESNGGKVHLTKQKLLNVLESLRQTVKSLRFDGFENVWGGYYKEASARGGYIEEKKSVIEEWLKRLPGLQSAIDIGGNRGEFARLVCAPGRRVICADSEHHAVEQLYKQVRETTEPGLFPVVMDFVTPSPALGLNNRERSPFFERAASDLALALAVVHHLAIGRNVPFNGIAQTCAALGRWLIIEWVPKEDEKTQTLLRNKSDVYGWYTQENFLGAFAALYRTVETKPVLSSGRTLYLMQRI